MDFELISHEGAEPIPYTALHTDPATADATTTASTTATSESASASASTELPVHVGVTCDVSGMSPIVGNRWHLVGHNYDLCDAEYNKLPDAQKERFVLIATPRSQPRLTGYVLPSHCN